jgi:hypothetical protein
MYAAAQFVGQPCHMGYHSFIKTLLNGAAWGAAIAVSNLTMSSVKIHYFANKVLLGAGKIWGVPGAGLAHAVVDEKCGQRKLFLFGKTKAICPDERAHIRVKTASGELCHFQGRG